MASYIIRRCLLGIVVLAGVSVLAFVLTRLVPSDPAARWVGPHARSEQIAAARVKLGLDKPLYVQYMRYVGSLLHGDLGVSIWTHQPVLQDILTYLPASLELILFGMLIALCIGVPLGIVSAARSGRALDHASRLFSVAGVALPAFWLGMILQLLFFKELRWFPLAGRLDLATSLASPIRNATGFYVIDSLISGNLRAFVSSLWHLILPGIALAAYPTGMLARMTRATMLQVLGEDYVRTPRAYGQREIRILTRHALRNAMGPVVTLYALAFAYSLVETFLIESVFAWPGLGYYASNAIMVVDYPAVMGVTILVAFAYVVLNLLADLTLAFLDPRVRLSQP